MPTAQLPALTKPPNPASPRAQEQARARGNSGCPYPGDPAAETPGFAWAGGGGGREAWVSLTPRRHPPSGASPAPAGSSALPGTPPTVTTKNVRGAWRSRQGERLLTETPSGQVGVRPEPVRTPVPQSRPACAAAGGTGYLRPPSLLRRTGSLQWRNCSSPERKRHTSHRAAPHAATRRVLLRHAPAASHPRSVGRTQPGPQKQLLARLPGDMPSPEAPHRPSRHTTGRWGH